MRRGRYTGRLLLRCLIAFTVGVGGPAAARAADAPGAKLDDNSDHRFPASASVVDVTRPPYGATGDGRTDDTAAIQKPLNDTMGLHKVLYFPNGTYLVSATLDWSNKNAAGQTAYGFNWVQEQNPLKTVIRLKANTFTDPAEPKAACGAAGSGRPTGSTISCRT